MRQTGAFLFSQTDEITTFHRFVNKRKNPKTNHISDSSFNQRL